MATEDSLNQSMDRVVKHYSSLFWLPSYGKMFSLLASSCLAAGILFTITLFPQFEALANGLFLGFCLFLVNLTSDYFISMVILGRDPVYDFRRTAGLSLFCWALWLSLISVGVALAMFFGLSWVVRLCLFGFSAVLLLRLVVLNSTSSTGYSRLLAASILQPFPCIVPFLAFWGEIDYSLTIMFLILSTVVSILSSSFFISILNRVGERTLGTPSLSLFKAFLLNWIVGLNAPFEEFLEKLGEEQDLKVSLIKFDASKPKAIIVVPFVHPGPFKNVGSSLLPFMLKNTLENELDCIACVPLGLLGHELDLASQVQNQRIIKRVVESANFKSSEASASPFIKVSNSLASACCQVFGKFVILSFTLAPKTTEDLPQELGLFAEKEAEKHGLTHCAVVNTHNSINGVASTQQALNAMKAAAAKCLEQAASSRRLPFKVGAATVAPREFSLEDGMGLGGITSVVVEVGENKTAYVVIDANNMVSGLREKILSTLKSIGMSEGEVFTTDTHSVNALILGGRGYHPIGEAIDHEKLIAYIREATIAAVSDMERSKASARSITIHNAKVIGEKKLETLCLLADGVIQKAKKTILPVFAPVSLLLILFLMRFIS